MAEAVRTGPLRKSCEVMSLEPALPNQPASSRPPEATGQEVAASDSFPYTDLALEAQAALRGQTGREIPGVAMQEERQGDITITRVRVLDQRGAQAIGKLPGNYITLEAPGLRERNRDLQEKVGAALVGEIKRMLPAGTEDPVLIVGVGNWNATPDALGPRVVNQVMVTRHLKDFVPVELHGGLRPVSAVSPGVLGLTGIETSEIIRGIVDRTRPAMVIAIDALAARSIERIGTTIQLADTGINPGSGIGNRRAGINRESLGVPVLAIGVPTVVHAATIANDTIDALANAVMGRSPMFFEVMRQFGHEDRGALIREVLSPRVGNLVVTPKEVDELISDLAKVIAGTLNDALHPSVHAKDMLRYLM